MVTIKFTKHKLSDSIKYNLNDNKASNIEEITHSKQKIVLFDEIGTPTFSEDRETDSFLGVSCTYKFSDELNIFEKCNNLFGLSNSNPKKNNKIKSNIAINIADLIGLLPVQIVVRKLKLNDTKFKQSSETYEKFSNDSRLLFRNIYKPRPIAQILHSNILNDCLFDVIVNHLEKCSELEFHYDIFIDNWSIPILDNHIYLQFINKSLEEKIKSLLKEKTIISISPIKLFVEDSQRKRFIDTVASIISRAFLKTQNRRYSEEPFNRLKNLLGNKLDFKRSNS